jgi:hypothetical protein
MDALPEFSPARNCHLGQVPSLGVTNLNYHKSFNQICRQTSHLAY